MYKYKNRCKNAEKKQTRNIFDCKIEFIQRETKQK